MPIDRRVLLATAVGITMFPTLAHAQDEQPTPTTEVLVDVDPPWMIMAGDGSGPLGRWGHTLVADTWNHRLLLIGGRDENGTVKGDLWSFDLASWSWTDVDLSGPKARAGSAAAIAPDGSGFYYFGGASNDAVYDDLWWFDFAASDWQLITPSGAGPSARFGTKGVMDAQGRFVISHGTNGDTLFDDTWAYDPVARTWTDISPAQRPMARSDHDLLSLPDWGAILLTGGCSEGIGPCPQGDLWVFDVYGGTWIDVTPFAGPSARTGSAMARLNGTIIQVGGWTDLGAESDVWRGTFDGGTVNWQELTLVNHGPMGIYRRYLHDMAAAGDEYYVFGGHGVEGALGDLWQFSLSRFQESEHSIEPTDDFDDSGDDFRGDFEDEDFEDEDEDFG